MSDTDTDIFEAQSEVVDRLNSFISNFKKTPKERVNLGYIAARDVGLKEIWAEFVNNHKVIKSSSTAEQLASNEYFTSNVFENSEEKYFIAAGLIKQKELDLTTSITNTAAQKPQTSQSSKTIQENVQTVHQQNPPLNNQLQVDSQQVQQPNLEAGAQQNPQPIAQQNADAFHDAEQNQLRNLGMPNYHHVQIPRLNVPTFSGSYEEWSSFRDLFIAAVHSNPTLQAVHKLQYLKSLMKGSAEALLRQTPITNENYAIAWRTLEDRFNNRRALITIQLQKLFNQTPADETATSIRQLLDTTRECVNSLQIQNIDTSSWDCILIYLVSRNIPSCTLALWEQTIMRNELPTFARLLEFLENRFRTLEFSPVQTLTPLHQGRSRPRQQTFLTASTNCRVCQGTAHPLRLCPKFLEMQVSQRLTHITKTKLCKNCFAFSHQTQACKSSGNCNVCGSRHHSLLHLNPNQTARSMPTSASSVTSSTSSSTPTSSSAYVVNHTTSLISRPTGASTDDTIILGTALVKITAFDGKVHSFRALLDNASQESFVSKRVVQFLGTKPEPTTMTVSGVGQSQAPKPLGQVCVTFGSYHDPTFEMSVSAIVLPIITYNLPNKSVFVDNSLISNLELADPTYGIPGEIDMLLSASVFAALTLPSIKKAESTIALHTKLGWILYGEATTKSSSQQRTCFHITSEDKVSVALQDFWKIEEVTDAPMHSKDDLKCEQIFKQTHSRNTDGRYCVQLPFKDEKLPTLGLSRDRAVKRLLQVERKLASDDKLREEYSKCLEEYVQLGHMYPITSTEEQDRQALPNEFFNQASYYLPHHAVIKTESTTTKVRVVFDASSKTSNGISLNDTLLTGPVLQDNLFNLLVRWRTHRIVIKADIEKMYRQILINKIHQSYQRIVWRNNSSEPIQDYQLQTVTFGTAAAPYLAIKTLYQLAEDESQRYPIGASTLRTDFYVDDLLSGADTVADATEKQRQVIEILRQGGFQIRKWSSNNNEITDCLQEGARELGQGKDSTLKTLGILWCPKADHLSIKVTLCPNQVSTKRTLLSEVAKLFDPLGWIAPAIISMKVLLQKLWLAGLSWDEPLPCTIQRVWNDFYQQLPSIEQIHINRWLNTPENPSFELHGFSDASECAYAAAVYLRVQLPNLKWAVHLVAAKTKVAPVKQVSLPRLELCAATLLAKLLHIVNASLKPTRIYAWSDSEIVLAWLQGHPNRWTTFVANRVSEIHNTLDAASWHHIASKHNPADCASRGIPPEQLVLHPLWWHGPTWLLQDEQDWPRKPKKDIGPTILEAKNARAFVIVPNNDTITLILDKCSSLTKAIRLTAIIRRWLSKNLPRDQLLLVAELKHAKQTIIQHVQNIEFFEEIKLLKSNLQIPTKSKIKSLNPFLDSDLLLRVGGRLKNADIPYDAKHPIIIPRKSRLTDLLIDETHQSTMHGGASLMLAHLRDQFWLIDSRNSIRHRIHKCNTCYRYSNPSLKQLMGNLPKPRVNAAPPFGHTGVDYAGPITIRLRRSPGRPLTSKGYICLFVCLATKAIHLELVGDMSAETFLAALNRFTSRRGLPSDIYSDNGTYFIRASHDIDRDMMVIQKQHEKEAAEYAAQRAIQWHFIPPAAPHFGGLWEAGIKSTKTHLKRIIGAEILTYEQMTTTLCQIESCLNSRPLCPISSDPNDFQILTPGHFLIGRPLLSRPQPSVIEIPSNRLNHWQRIYKITEQFWRQWQTEYFSRLQQRPKWLSETTNIEKDDLVILREDNLAPSQWKLARVIETHPGVDGLTRVVTIKTPTTILKRPITKICKLPSQ